MKTKHLEAVEARIASVGAEIAASMYCDTAAEALTLAGESRLKHEAHVVRLRPLRDELAFLELRRIQLGTK